MAGGLLKRKTVIAFAHEPTEGTRSALAAAAGTMLVYDQSFSPDVGRFDRNPARRYLSRLAAVQGKRMGTVSFRTELKGSGVLATKPAWNAALISCGFTVTTISTQSIGAITGGPFFPGEEVITSGRADVARVVGEINTGDSLIHYVPTSDTIGDNVEITGVTSGATCQTTSVAASDKGWEYRPQSSLTSSGTCGFYVDGLAHIMTGARGNVRIETGAVGEPAFLAFEFMGVYSTTSNITLPTPSYESTIPQPFMNVDSTVLGFASPILASVNVDMSNTVVAREDASAVYGIRSFIITERAPSCSMDPELELTTVHDFYGSLSTGTTGRSYFELGTLAGTGQRITVGMPRCQYSGIGDGERTGLAVADVDMDLISASVTTGDDELQIGMVS